MNPTDAQRLDALHRIDSVLIAGLRKERDYWYDEPVRLLRQILQGGELTVMGIPVKFTCEPSLGVTAEQLLEWLPEPKSQLF